MNQNKTEKKSKKKKLDTLNKSEYLKIWKYYQKIYKLRKYEKLILKNLTCHRKKSFLINF